MSSTPPVGRNDVLAFADARGCKDWLNALPLTNIPQAQALVLEALRSLNRCDFDAMERLKCLELMRDKIAFLQGEQRARYFGKSLPLSANDTTAWTTGLALLEEMQAGYARSLEEARAATPLASHAALISQRIVRYLGAQMLFHAIVYRRFDPQLWTRLHGVLRQGEQAGIAQERVKDSLESDESGSSVAAAYAHVVLVQAAYLSELSAPQIDFVEALLRAWIRKVAVRSAPEDGAAVPETHPLAVDLEKPIGARPLAHAQLEPRHRIVDVAKLSASLRKRIHALRRDEDPLSLGIPVELGAVGALHQLQRLHRLWCEGAPPRPAARVPQEKTAGLAFGLPEIHFFVSGGKPFEQPDGGSRELTSQEKQEIEVFGQVTSRTQSKMVVEHNYVAENWAVIDEILGAWRLQRPQTSSRGVSIGKLVAMRAGETGTFYLGMVSALVQETDGRVVITVTLFPGRPEPVPVRAADPRQRATARWSEGFRLPALDRLHIPASIVVASGVASRGRRLEMWRGGGVECTVHEILERGTDFDRITAS